MGEPSVFEIDIVAEVPLPQGANQAELERLAAFAFRQEDATGVWSVAIVLTSDPALRVLHRDYLGDDSETDIMTFPMEPDTAEGGRGGDIVISVDRAAANARDVGHSTWDELRFLVVHGVLHLCGWLDHSGEERSAMLARQSEIIVAFDG